MYRRSLFSSLVFWLVILIVIGGLSSFGGSDKAYIKSVKRHRKERKKEFRDPSRSPLGDKAKKFKGLAYFPISPEFKVKATLKKTPGARPFKIPTNDPNISKDYVSYGKLYFDLKGKPKQLVVYKSLAMFRLPQSKTLLFLPFRDQTTGRESYGGGRYLDLQVPDGEEIILDFNLAYNPNCVYSEGWSCPIPPAENTLDVPIEAGEKNYPDSSY